MEATGGFEPPNRGFANPRLRPLGYVASESSILTLLGRLEVVPRVGLEPTRPFEHYALNVACLPISASRPDQLAGLLARIRGEFWQERQDSNPRPLVLETNALAN